MVNIILDTNTWIYLANGYDQSTGNYQDGLHFKLLKEIKDLISKGRIKLYSNETVLLEWERNKAAVEKQIKAKQKTLTNNKNNIRGIKKSLGKEAAQKLDEVQIALEEAANKEIDLHIAHVKEVEALLKNAEVIPIKDEIYVTAGKLAIQKKAPFHNKANSFGDAVILFSAVEYFKDKGYEWIGNTIFVSNNSDDYCVEKGSKEIHPDLAPYLKEADITFELNIAKALNLSEEISEQIDAYYKYEESHFPCLASCYGERIGLATVEYETLKILPDGIEAVLFNPRQIPLFAQPEFQMSKEEVDAINIKNSVEILIGCCNHCNTHHIICECGHEHQSPDDDYHIYCDCGREIYIDNKEQVHVLEN